MREATLAVRNLTLVVKVALLLIYRMGIVHSIIAAATRLTKYPLRQVNVSGEIGALLKAVTAFATLP